MKTLEDFYDDTAKDWAEEWYNNNLFIPIFKDMFTYLPNQPTILDVGCGAGYESMRLHNLGAKVVGIDLSEKSLEIAREKNPSIKFEKRDITLPYTDLGLFDAIVSIGVIIHFDENSVDNVLKNIADVIKPNGYALITVRDGTNRRETATYNNVEYARNFIKYTPEKFMQFAGVYFDLVKIYPTQDTWKSYLLKKK